MLSIVLTKFYIFKNSYVFFYFFIYFLRLYKIDIFMLSIKIFNRFVIMCKYQLIHFITIHDIRHI